MVVVFLSVASHAGNSDVSRSAEKFKVFASDGKGSRMTLVQLKSQSSLTENLEENILILHPDLAWAKDHPKEEPKYLKPNFQSGRIGAWRTYEVWDVNDLSNKTYNIVLKSGPSAYRLIYSLQPVDQTVSPLVGKTVLSDTGNEMLKEITVYKTEKYRHLISLDREQNPVVTDAKPSAKSITEGKCISGAVQIVFEDGMRKDFPVGQSYACQDFKLSPDHRYAGWKATGEMTAKTGDELQKYPDASLTVLIGDQTYSVIEGARYIKQWFFTPGQSQIVVETAFEHGPSTYSLFDLQNKKVIETCGEFELNHCAKLKLLVKAAEP